MWFVILKTLLSEDPGAGSAQPEMLLVADDANAAYSNPRQVPKCADSPAVYPIRIPHPGASHAPMSCRAKKTHPGVLELVRTLQSIIWGTEVRTFPPHAGTGAANSLGNRRPGWHPEVRGLGTTDHETIEAATAATRPTT